MNVYLYDISLNEYNAYDGFQPVASITFSIFSALSKSNRIIEILASQERTAFCSAGQLGM
jgi:hypothetical protein